MTQHRRRQRRPLRRSTIWTRSTRLRAGRSCGSCSSTPPRRISVTVTSGDAVTAWCGTIGARCTHRLRLTTARSGGSCGGARPPSLPSPSLPLPSLPFLACMRAWLRVSVALHVHVSQSPLHSFKPELRTGHTHKWRATQLSLPTSPPSR